MNKKFTFYARTIACTALTLGVLAMSFFTSKTYAQSNCANSAVLFSENFGTGTTSTSSPDVLSSGLTYQGTGSLANEGVYRIANSTQQKPEWHASEDHTAGDINGKMLVVNGQAETFYRRQINSPGGFLSGDYTASFFIMNVNTPGTCAPDPLLTAISLRLEYLSEAGTWIPLTGSPFPSAPLAQTVDATWVGVGTTFNLPLTGDFVVKSLRLVLSDGTVGGCGNDFALDDIIVSQCTEGGPTPVTFLSVNARQKGSGIGVEWSTSQELNNKSFVIEKSADGNSGWGVVATINGAGNSSIVRNYSAYDAHPFKSVNFYRVKQVDIDGHFQYSKTVSVRLNTTKTGVTIIENPFHNSLTVDFSSITSQAVSVHLADITGKLVASEKWVVNAGNSRKDFSNVNGLQRGIYVLTISNAAGEILYNNKVIKQ